MEARLWELLSETVGQIRGLGGEAVDAASRAREILGTLVEPTVVDDLMVYDNVPMFIEKKVVLLSKDRRVQLITPHFRTTELVSGVDKCESVPQILLRGILEAVLNKADTTDAVERGIAEVRAEADRFAREVTAGAPARLEAALEECGKQLEEIREASIPDNELRAFEDFIAARDARISATKQIETERRNMRSHGVRTDADLRDSTRRVLEARTAEIAAIRESDRLGNEFRKLTGIRAITISWNSAYTHRIRSAGVEKRAELLCELAKNLADNAGDVTASLVYRVVYACRMLAVVQSAYAFAQMLEVGAHVDNKYGKALGELARAAATGTALPETKEVEELKLLFGEPDPEVARRNACASRLAEIEDRLAELERDIEREKIAQAARGRD